MKSNGEIHATPELVNMIATFIELRTALAEHEVKTKEFNSCMAELRGLMVIELHKIGAELIRTDAGTVSLSEDYSARLHDPDKFMEFVVQNELYDLLERRANKKACKDYCEENGRLPPGVTIDQRQTVNVRKPSEK